MITPNEFPIFQAVYPEVKFWFTVGTAFWGLFKGVEWIKGIKTNDLPHIQAGVDSLKDELRQQTASIVREHQDSRTAIVNELHESRNEMRTYFSPRRRRTPPKRK